MSKTDVVVLKMHKKTNKLQKLYRLCGAKIVQRFPFYKFSLQKKSNIFDKKKFITEPWTGSPVVGKNILDGCLCIDFAQHSVDILSIVSKKKELASRENGYVYTFSWIRDLQAIGGHYSRKYARNAINEFIDTYRSTNTFWLRNFSWKPDIVAERIVNWILSYSFFASGASDKFQKKVLSSINEQFSHLSKIYKAEFDPYAKILVLKALLFCLIAMKNPQFSKIQKIFHDLEKTINDNFQDDGMFFTRNPTDHFNLFRSLLEIRFMAKENRINATEIFNCLQKIGACVRFLRLGDGGCSRNFGDKKNQSYMLPSQHIVDTALSLIDNQPHSTSVLGFERLATKEIVLLVNTKVSEIKSIFNNAQEPGINIFDFEASFGENRVVNRADISILFNNFRIKAEKTSQCFVEKEIVDDALCFDGEAQVVEPLFSFAMKRSVSINLNKQKISSCDIAYISGNFEAFFRIAFHKHAEIEKINAKKFLIYLNKKEFLFNINDASDVFEATIKDEGYPSIEIAINGQKGKEALLDWSLEEIK